MKPKEESTTVTTTKSENTQSEKSVKSMTSEEKPVSKKAVEMVKPKPLDLHRAEFEDYYNTSKPRLVCRFNKRIKSTELKKFIKIAPEIAYDYTTSGTRLYLVADFDPETIYTVTLTKELTALDGNSLSKGVVVQVKSPSLKPMFRFLSSKLFLPITLAEKLPVTIQNKPEINFTLTKIYPNNYVHFLRDGNYSSSRYGAETSFTWKHNLPKEKTTAFFPLSDYLTDKAYGFYRLKEKYSYGRSGRTILITDIAVEAVQDGDNLVVSCHSISSSEILSNCSVEIYSSANQLLASSDNCQNGLYHLSIEPETRPFMVVVRNGDDLSILPLSYEYDNNLRNARGKQINLAGKYDAWCTTERGVYRPNESVYLMTLVKDNTTDLAAKKLPVEIKVYDSRRNLYYIDIIETDDFGYIRTKFALNPGLLFGSYRITVGLPGKNGDVWGRCYFTVEHYVPDRIKVAVNPNKNVSRSSENLEVEVSGMYNFGGPVFNSKATLGYRAYDRPYFSKKLKNYQFPAIGILDAHDRVGTQKTDENGSAKFTLPLKELTAEAKGYVVVECSGSVTEVGGRSVSASKQVSYLAKDSFFGLKHNGGGNISWGHVNAKDELVPIKRDCRYELFSKNWQYVLKNDNDTLTRHWQEKLESVATGEFKIESATGDFSIDDLEYGSYRLKFFDGVDEHQLDLYYYSSENPKPQSHAAYLHLKANGDEFNYGDEVVLTFDVPVAGDAILHVTGEKLFLSQRMSVTAGKNNFKFKVPATKYRNIHAAVNYVRLPKKVKLPRRLFGGLSLKVKNDQNRVDLSVDCHEKVFAGDDVIIEVKSKNLPESGVKVQLMAVDEGILALTNFQAPSPFDYFYGQVYPTSKFYDTWDHITPELTIKNGKISEFGGGKSGPWRRRKPEEKLEKLEGVMVLDDFVINSDSEKIKIKAPNFIGKMWVMAFAFDGQRYSEATMSSLTVVKPVTILMSAPRCAAFDDEFTVTLNMFNNDREFNDLELTLSDESRQFFSCDVVDKFSVKSGENLVKRVNVKPLVKISGNQKLTFILKSSSKELVRESKSILLRPTYHYQSDVKSLTLKAGETTKIAANSNYFPATETTTINVSCSSISKINGALDFLSKYPYGCLEQTVSATFAAIYARKLRGEPAVDGIYTSDSLKVREAIRRLQKMALSSGGFSMWPGGDHIWESGSVYAAHFILEAERNGYQIDYKLKRNTLTFLRKLAYNQGFEDQYMFDRVYALYLLAQFKKGESNLTHALLKDSKIGDFERIILAGTFYELGDAKLAVEIFNSVKSSNYLSERTKSELDSKVRRVALALDVALKLVPDNQQLLNDLFTLVQGEQKRHWGTTQQNAMAVFAFGKWVENYPIDRNSQGVVTLADGKEIQYKGGEDLVIELSEKDLKGVTISCSTGTLYTTVLSYGLPKEAPKSMDNGVTVKREYFDLNNQPVTTFIQGDLYQCKISLTSSMKYRKNMVIEDLLPAGLEIENSAFATRDKSSLKEQLKGVYLNYKEVRDDRMVYFFDILEEKATMIYPVRAVTYGRFSVPECSIESMYSPEVKAIQSAQGVVEVK